MIALEATEPELALMRHERQSLVEVKCAEHGPTYRAATEPQTCPYCNAAHRADGPLEEPGEAPMAKKQAALPGMERKTISEVDDAAEAYEDARDERMKLTEQEKSAKVALLSVMKKHKLQVYKDESASPPIVVTVEEGEENVKVKRIASDEPTAVEPKKRKKRASADETQEAQAEA